MVCRNCGNEIRDGGKFCPHCGALSRPDPDGGLPREAASVPDREGPEGRKKKTGLILAAAVAAAAVIALLAVAVSGLFASPKQKLERAVVKSLASYAQAGKALSLPHLGRLSEERSVTQRASLRLTSLDTAVLGYDLSALKGLDLRFQSDLEAADRKLGIELAAFWDDQELLSILLAADDAEVCLSSPQLTGGDFYGVNTETLGEDLRRMGAQDLGDVSFNLFDLLDIIAPEGQAEETEQAMKEAAKALFDAMRAERGGKETIYVNQTEIRTDVYRVTIPKEAVKNYMSTVVLSGVDYMAVCREVCRAMGAPEDVLAEFPGDLEGPDSYGDLAASLEALLDETGDMELTVYVSGGYVSAVIYGDYPADGGAFLALYLGGGEAYVDNLRLEVDVDGQRVTIDSSGDHGCKSGVFTDETTVRGPFSAVTSEFRYEPGSSQDNLSWEINVLGAGSLEMAGQLTCGEASVDLCLDELTLKLLGMELCSAEMDYYVGPCQGQSVTTRDPRLIGEMDNLELMLAALNLWSNAQSWVGDMRAVLTARLPKELLGWMR